MSIYPVHVPSTVLGIENQEGLPITRTYDLLNDGHIHPPLQCKLTGATKEGCMVYSWALKKKKAITKTRKHGIASQKWH